MYEYIFCEVPSIPATLEEINISGMEIVSVFYSADSQQVHFIVKSEPIPEEKEKLGDIFGR